MSFENAFHLVRIVRSLLSFSIVVVWLPWHACVREFLKLYVDRAPRTYNNVIDGLKVFIGRHLQRANLLNGLKHTYVPECLEQFSNSQLCKCARIYWSTLSIGL